MKKITFLIVLLLMSVSLFALEPHFMKHPALSPDGTTVYFSYMSDIWTVSCEGGEAKRLTVSKGNDIHPVVSPDGKTIAFTSNRDGFWGTYLIPSEGGEAQRICEEGVTVIDWFASGKKLLATKYELPNGWNFMEVPLDGSHPTVITEIGNSLARLTPDNKKIIFSNRGYSTRERYIGSVNGQIWEYDIKEKSYTQLTNTEYTEMYPVCSFVHDRIYYVGADFIKDNRAVFQIYSVDDMDFSHPQKLTDFDYWSATQLSIARQNDNMVFKLFDELWSYNAKKDTFRKINIEIKQDFLESFDVTEDFVNKASNFSVSPSGKMVAFTYKFDLFAMPEKGGEVKQLTFNQKGIEDIQIADDDKTIYFTSFNKGNKQLYSINITKPEKIETLSWFKDSYVEDIYFENEMGLFVHYSTEKARNQVALVEQKKGKVEKLISDQVVRSQVVVSPDKKYAIYFVNTSNTWDEILYLYNFQTKEKTALYPFHGNMHSPVWGEQGAYIFFNRNQDICRMDLHAKEDFWDYKDHWKEILNPDESEEDEEEEKDKDSDDNDKKDIQDSDKGKGDEEIVVTIDLEDINRRVSVIASKRNYNYIVATDEDSTLYYVSYSDDDKYTLRKVDYEGKKDEELTVFLSRPRYVEYNEENDCFYCIESNSITKITTSGSKEILENEFTYTYDSFDLNKSVFDQAWKAFQYGFYDPDMHGIDWEKAYKKYAPYLEYAYSPEIMDEIYTQMMGEVNASHTGFYARNDDPVEMRDIAYGGFVLDFEDIPNKGIKFKKIFRKSKLNKPYNIKPGDILLEVDGVKIKKDTPIAPLFFNKINDKITMKVQTPDSIATVEFKGHSWREDYSMNYDTWVEERKKIVDAQTDGKVGYAHIQDMGWNSYEDFLQDVFANNWEKDALIIDVRNNPGGWIHDWLIELLTKKPYAFTTNRIFNVEKKPFPADTWTRPTILLINQNSFSDAEIFPNIYQHFGLGKVIGMPTSGSVIGTGSWRFMDGSSMRMPGTGWYTVEDLNMEGTGAKPDIYLDQTYEQKIADDDVQLKKAIEEILKELQ